MNENETQELNVMQIGVPYIVASPGANGDLQVGFHVLYTNSLALYCPEREGYIADKALIDETLEGVELVPDLLGIKFLRLQHLEAIKGLSSFPEPSDEAWEAYIAEGQVPDPDLDPDPDPADVLLDMSVGTDNPQ